MGQPHHYTQLRLDPLGSESADEMLTALLGLYRLDRPPSPMTRETGARGDQGSAPDGHRSTQAVVIERTQGNPFFIEEIVQALFDEGVLVRNGAVKVAARWRRCICRRPCRGS